MDGLKEYTYLKTTRKRFDPFSLIVSIAGIGAVLVAVAGVEDARQFFQMRSFLIVFAGTLACILFQYDFKTFFLSLWTIVQTFWGTPRRRLVLVLNQLDEAIVNNATITTLRAGTEINGDILNDIVYMYNRGLLFDEIDEFVTSRISEMFLERYTAVAMLRRASVLSPALGLFGTVIGLIGVLNTLNDPSNIGPPMSLALLTTAYGAGLGSLVFTPFAGRLEHHNIVYLHNYKRLMSKVAVLLRREERQTHVAHKPVANES